MLHILLVCSVLYGCVSGVNAPLQRAVTSSATVLPTATSFSTSSFSETIHASTTTIAETSVPTDVPIQGDYTGAYRPRVHFSPPKGFMNDPNGMFVDANGTWHLCYQYNPTAVVAGNQHWGHATSPDLYHWTNQPIALYPPTNDSGIFSGSAVVDPNNTSGFFPAQSNGVVAIYTLNTPQKQTQNLAYSTDGGYKFTTYDEGNPVLDLNSTQFRDPKVIWYKDHWVMIVAFSTEFVIGIYTSPDLKDWTHASNVSHVGLLGLQYECPNLVQIPVDGSSETMYVLTISLNPGSPQGGSITEYFPGTFNGTHFSPVDAAARISDFAKDNYAGQFFYGTPSDQAISMAWASNWQYTNRVPTGDSEGWRSAMTLPRRQYLANISRVGWDLVSAPYGLEAVLAGQLSYDSDLVNRSVSVNFDVVDSLAIYFSANISIPAAAEDEEIPPYATLNFTFSTPQSGEKITGGYFFGGDNAGQMYLDRTQTYGYGPDDPFYSTRFSVAQAPPYATRIEGVLDRTLLEVFIDGGALSGTMLAFPTAPFQRFEIATTGMPQGSKVEIGVWALDDTWNRGSGPGKYQA